MKRGESAPGEEVNLVLLDRGAKRLVKGIIVGGREEKSGRLVGVEEVNKWQNAEIAFVLAFF